MGVNIADDELVDLYFGDILPQNELQLSVMRTYAFVFEQTYLPESERPSGLALLKLITEKHSPEELFSSLVLCNMRIVTKVRTLLSQQDLHPDPQLGPRDRIVFKLAHILYPGEANASMRERANKLCKRFIEAPRMPAISNAVSRCDASASVGVQAHSNGLSAASRSQSLPGTVSSFGFSSSPQQFGFIQAQQSLGQYQHMQSTIAALMDQNRVLQSQITSLMNPMSSVSLQQPYWHPTGHVSLAIPPRPQTSNYHPQSSANAQALFVPRETSQRDPRFTPRRNENRGSDSNAHYHINQRFKSKESKYSGSDDENLQDFIDAYTATAEDYRISPSEKLQYLHNLFRVEAMRFYNAQVKGRYSTFGEAIGAVYQHYNSPDVQQRVEADLSSLKLQKFTEKEGSMAKGLSSLANYIANRTPQCPPCFRTESNKVDFLKQAFLDQPWARAILVRINPSTQFQHLYTELANALQLNQEMLERQGIPVTKSGASSKQSKPFIYFTQPRIMKSMAKAMFPGYENASEC